MKLYPTRDAVHLGLCGAAVVGAGIVSAEPSIVGWGGALLVGLAAARAATFASVSRIRAAGFEMVWSEPERVRRVARGETVTLRAEVRNRDTLAARYVGLRVIASSALDVRVDPSAGEVPAGGKLEVSIDVRGDRVGRHGLFGLSLEVRGAPGLFEVPLTFANPFGLEVLPRAWATELRGPRGGRTRVAAMGGREGRARGEGSDLRELRDYVPGDPLKRVAWRASARRGKLLVREVEREERDFVWIVLDASVELWAGELGRAPLDLAIDDAASLISRHARGGDAVGLSIVAARELSRVEPDRGARHASSLLEELAFATSTHDRDRSDLEEAEVGLRVLEHLRPLDQAALSLSRRDLDRISARAAASLGRAPFPEVALPTGVTLRERRLRQYLAAYGVTSPPRAEPEHAATSRTLARVVAELAATRPRATVIYVLGPQPATEEAALSMARRGRSGPVVRWVLSRFAPSLSTDAALSPAALAVREAALLRIDAGQRQAERRLRALGVKVQRPR